MAASALASRVAIASVASLASSTSVQTAAPKSVSVKAAPVRCAMKESEEVPRRVLVSAASAALLAAFVGPAMAIGPAAEPPIEKKGRQETIKKYANICSSMPTASVCHG